MPRVAAGLDQRHQAAALDRAGLVDHDEHGRQRRARRRCRSLACSSASTSAEGVVRRRGQLRAAERASVGQPLEERPVGEPALADEGHDGQVGRAVHRGRLHDERAGEGAGRRQRAGEADAADARAGRRAAARRRGGGSGRGSASSSRRRSRAPPLATLTVVRDGSSAVPTRRRRKSASSGARSHSRSDRLRTMPPSSPAPGSSRKRPRTSSIALLLEVVDLLGDDGAVLGEGLLELVLAGAPGLDHAADQQHRRQQHEDRPERADQEVHDDAEEHRQGGADHRQALAARPVGRRRQLDLDPAVRAGDPRRAVELDAVARRQRLDGADVVADRQRQVADLRRLPGPQHGRRGDRRVADDDAVLRAEVGDRDDVGDRDAGVVARGLLVLDDDVVVGVATEPVVAVAQRVLGLGAGRRRHDERRAERLGRRREDGVDRVDERQPVAGAHVDVGDAVVAARRLAGAGDRQRAAVVVEEREGVGHIAERRPRLDLEHDVGGAAGTMGDLDEQLHRSDGTDRPAAGCPRGRLPVGRSPFRSGSWSQGRPTSGPKRQSAGAVAVRDRDPRLGVADLGHGVLPVVLAGAAHHEQVAAAEVERQRRARRRAGAGAAAGARRR